MVKRRSKIWNNRTVRFSAPLFDALYEYAKRHRVAMSPVAHFLLERALAEPLDMAAFNAWQPAKSHRTPAAASNDPGVASTGDSQRAVKQREPRQPRVYTCSVCGELGHNAQRHDASRSAEAAKVAVAEGLSLAQAGERFGITREAVRQALRRDFGAGRTPAKEKRHQAVEQMVALAEAGRTVREIAAEMSVDAETVRRRLWERGVKAHNEQPISEDEAAAAANDVVNGASYAEAAADIGRSEQRVAARVRAMGIVSTATSAGRDRGRMARAIARVEAGESVPEACHAERCSTVPVYQHFKRLRAT